MEKSLIAMLANPSLIEALIRRIMDFLLPFTERMLSAAGGRIDFFRIGDDFGTQKGLLIGAAQWREFFQPALEALAQTAHRHGARLYLHSCGSVRALIPDFIASGVDVLDPLQVQAAGMNPAELKAEFGRRLCFSGGVDEQELLPRGTPSRIQVEVKRLLDIMAREGGFFLGPTHNFQDDIPTPNITAMYAAAKQWRGYE
jgi:uroporphyrinogen-III decarboxylase